MTKREPVPKDNLKQDPGSGLFLPPAVLEKQIAILDHQDELEVVFAEKTGAEIETWLYEFKIDGRPVKGLGIKGMEACFGWHHKAPGRVQPGSLAVYDYFDPKQESRIFTCGLIIESPDGKASRPGVASALEYPKRYQSEQRYFNLFAAATAASKAERNAMRKLVPTKQRTQFEQRVLLAKYGAGRVKQLGDFSSSKKRKETGNVQEWDKQSRALHAEAHKLGLPVEGLHGYLNRQETKALKRPVTSFRQIPVKHLVEWTRSLRTWDKRTMLLVYKGCGVKPAEALKKYQAARGKK